MDRQLRRQRNTLSIAGTALMAFGVWTAVRTFMFFTAEKQTIIEIKEASKTIDMDPEAALALIIGLALVYIVVELCCRTYVCLRARAEARGKKHSIRYVMVVTAIFLFNLSYVITAIKDYDPSYMDYFDFAFNMFIELSNMFAMLEVIVSAVRIRIILRRMEEA